MPQRRQLRQHRLVVGADVVLVDAGDAGDRIGGDRRQRLGGRRIARGVAEPGQHQFAEHGGVVAHLDVGRGEHAVALEFRQQLDGRGVVVTADAAALEGIGAGALAVLAQVDREHLVVVGGFDVDVGRGRVDRGLPGGVLLALVLELAHAGTGEFAVLGVQFFLLVVAVGQQHVEAVGIEVAEALRHREVGAPAAFFLRMRVGCFDVKGLLVLLQDEVDHAGDRVRAVQRRGAIGQDLDALDRGQRDRRPG